MILQNHWLFSRWPECNCCCFVYTSTHVPASSFSGILFRIVPSSRIFPRTVHATQTINYRRTSVVWKTNASRLRKQSATSKKRHVTMIDMFTQAETTEINVKRILPFQQVTSFKYKWFVRRYYSVSIPVHIKLNKNVRIMFCSMRLKLY